MGSEGCCYNASYGVCPWGQPAEEDRRQDLGGREIMELRDQHVGVTIYIDIKVCVRNGAGENNSESIGKIFLE